MGENRATSPVTRKPNLVRITCAVLILLIYFFININYVGRAASGTFDWRCESCNAQLHYCPGKRQNLLAATAKYQAHEHAWKLEHQRMPDWSRWKPWQWLAYFLANDPIVFERPNPGALFRKANVDLRDSHPDGLRNLSGDLQFEMRDYARPAADDSR